MGIERFDDGDEAVLVDFVLDLVAVVNDLAGEVEGFTGLDSGAGLFDGGVDGEIIIIASDVDNLADIFGGGGEDEGDIGMFLAEIDEGLEAGGGEGFDIHEVEDRVEEAVGAFEVFDLLDELFGAEGVDDATGDDDSGITFFSHIDIEGRWRAEVEDHAFVSDFDGAGW